MSETEILLLLRMSTRDGCFIFCRLNGNRTYFAMYYVHLLGIDILMFLAL